jgi:alcohol dehydrogenase YqhD (iron-dependent ADH family)
VVDYLPRVLSNLKDLEARTQLSWASTIACSQFAGLGGGDGSMTMHGIEHPLSGYYDIAHGDGLAALLPAWLASLADIRAERIAKLGCQVFGETDGLPAVQKWLERVGMNINLRDLSIEKDKLPELSANALKTASWLSQHPKRLTVESIARIYEAAW